MITMSVVVHDLVDEASVSLLVAHQDETNSEVLFTGSLSRRHSEGFNGIFIIWIVGV